MTKLRWHLLNDSGYKPYIRPVKNQKDPINVNVYLILIQIVDLVSVYFPPIISPFHGDLNNFDGSSFFLGCREKSNDQRCDICSGKQISGLYLPAGNQNFFPCIGMER